MLTVNLTALIVALSFVGFMFAMRAVFFAPLATLRAQREALQQAEQHVIATAQTDVNQLTAQYEAGLAKARQDASALIAEHTQVVQREAATTVANARQQAREHLATVQADVQAAQADVQPVLQQERQPLADVLLQRLMGPVLPA